MIHRVILTLACVAHLALCAPAQPPQSHDDRLIVELFAEHPLVVTPTGIDVDASGRVFVAESHTHFRPDDYNGPTHDRVLILTDSDGDGRSDARTIFHEGFTHVMDIEFHRDGSLYVATRMDIHRLRDTDGDDRADQIDPIVRMETTGTYPHNGLSGLAFGADGTLQFGLGENLGHEYTLVGSDGMRISGGGEGGSTYSVRPDGKGLRRITTGWWNPWGLCTDRFGRTFGTDNDPGASPPCRLIQIVEGADYGYEYRYGRTGLHPLISWTGQMSGTLPMVSGTGEAPCAIIAYESTALPSVYFGQLFVASWADHRIEHYALNQQPDQALVTTTRNTLVEGGNEFRPVGLAVAPDGTVYVSDWVRSSYTLHKQGRVWRIKPKASPRQLPGSDLPAAGLTTLDDRSLQHIAASATSLARRVGAVQLLMQRGGNAASWLHEDQPSPIVAVALPWADVDADNVAIRRGCQSADPAVFHAAVQALTRNADPPRPAAWQAIARDYPLAGLLALKRHPSLRDMVTDTQFRQWLASSDAELRFHAVKWIADDLKTQFRSDVAALLLRPELEFRLFLAVQAALDRLDGKKPSDRPSDRQLAEAISSPSPSTQILRWALRLIDPSFNGLEPSAVNRWIEHPEDQVKRDAIRTLSKMPDPQRVTRLKSIAANESIGHSIRSEAIAGLAHCGDETTSVLLEYATGQQEALRDEALRSLIGRPISERVRTRLTELKAASPELTEAVTRILSEKPDFSRPEATDTAGWMQLAAGQGDAVVGERIFFHSKIGTCGKCHQLNGRGAAVGPDLSLIHHRLASKGEQGDAWLMETILQPSSEMAPQYTPWQVITTDGKVLVGLPRRKGGNREAYLGIDGKEFSVKKPNIDSHREMPTSIMPAGLLHVLTTQELCDLMAFIKQAS